MLAYSNCIEMRQPAEYVECTFVLSLPNFRTCPTSSTHLQTVYFDTCTPHKRDGDVDTEEE